MKKCSVIVITITIIISLLAGCAMDKTGMVTPSTDLMNGIQSKDDLSEQDMEKWLSRKDIKESINDFSVALLKETLSQQDGENLLVSPISVLYAMSMCANGADEMTRVEMLSTLINGSYDGEAICGTRETEGEGDIFDEWQENLNGYLGSYLKSISNYKDNPGAPENPAELHIANSIWMKNDDNLTVEKDFLETNGKYYNAGLFKSNFDENARKQINKWIEDNTNGLIKDMLKEIPENAIMYLINALGFEAEWDAPYNDYQVQEGTFHGESVEADVKFMHSDEWGYLEDGMATGFIKRYAGWDYAFVGLLPNEGVSIDEYVNSLTGKGLYDLLNNVSDETVITSIPQFESESALSLVEAFKNMGIHKAFSVDEANFTKLGRYEGKNILIGNILHNTFIKVDQKGTKAGAATVVEMVAEGAFFNPEVPKEVHLDRPFVYMIIDTNQNIPLFIGIEKDI